MLIRSQPYSHRNSCTVIFSILQEKEKMSRLELNLQGMEEALKVKRQTRETGLQLTGFSIKNKTNDDPLYPAKIKIHGHFEEASVFVFPKDEEERVRAMAKISLKHHISHAQKILEFNFTASKTGEANDEQFIVCYEPIKHMFGKWIRSTTPHESWWVAQIKNALNALKVVHCRKIFHGKLDENSSYVINTKDLLNIINFGMEGADMDNNELKVKGRGYIIATWEVF